VIDCTWLDGLYEGFFRTPDGPRCWTPKWFCNFLRQPVAGKRKNWKTGKRKKEI